MFSATPGRSNGSAPDRGRRRWLQRITAGAVAPVTAGAGRPAQAHHGFAGSYDFSRPYYLAGRIENVWIGMPHVRLELRQASDLALPRDRERFRALEDAEGRQMLGRLRLLEGQDVVVISLHSRITRTLVADPDALPVGLQTELIGYRRLANDEYRNEIVGVLVRLADGRLQVASSPPVGRPRQPRNSQNAR